MAELLNTLANIGILILIIGILVFVHELGHFLAAKFFKARVDEFSLGFGPKLISKKIGETEYMIKALPLGGYVKILGEGDELPTGEGDDAEKALDEKINNDPRSLKSKPKYAQLIVMVAGVTMNAILAVILFYVVLARVNYTVVLTPDFVDFVPAGGTKTIEKTGDFIYSSLIDGGGAKEAGLPEKGLIKSADGKEFPISHDFQKYVRENPNKTIVMNVCEVETEESEQTDTNEQPDNQAETEDKDNTESNKNTQNKSETEAPQCKDYQVKISDKGLIGISYSANYYVQIKYEGADQLFAGFIHSANQVKLIGYYLPRLFQQANETGNYEKLATNGVSSPIALYYVIDSFKSDGIYPLLDITASLSFSLALINILPIPALDGGRILLILIEMIRRKPLKPRTEALIIGISFYLLMGLMLIIIIKDIVYIELFQKLFAR